MDIFDQGIEVVRPVVFVMDLSVHRTETSRVVAQQRALLQFFSFFHFFCGKDTVLNTARPGTQAAKPSANCPYITGIAMLNIYCHASILNEELRWHVTWCACLLLAHLLGEVCAESTKVAKLDVGTVHEGVGWFDVPVHHCLQP